MDHDCKILQGDLRRIYLLMHSGQWWSVNGIKQALCLTSGSAAITARIRDLRKPQYGGFVVETKPDINNKRLFWYRLDANRTQSTEQRKRQLHERIDRLRLMLLKAQSELSTLEAQDRPKWQTQRLW